MYSKNFTLSWLSPFYIHIPVLIKLSLNSSNIHVRSINSLYTHKYSIFTIAGIWCWEGSKYYHLICIHIYPQRAEHRQQNVSVSQFHSLFIYTSIFSSSQCIRLYYLKTIGMVIETEKSAVSKWTALYIGFQVICVLHVCWIANHQCSIWHTLTWSHRSLTNWNYKYMLILPHCSCLYIDINS